MGFSPGSEYILDIDLVLSQVSWSIPKKIKKESVKAHLMCIQYIRLYA